MSKINCVLVTVWDGGQAIRTKGLLDDVTGEIESLESVDADVTVLEREYLEMPDDTTLEVCKTCHEFILKSVMVPGNTKGILIEEFECSGPDCENKR